MKDSSGYLGKIKKLNETLDQGVMLDDLMAMWDLSSDMMMIIQEGKIIHVNNACCVIGYDKNDLHDTHLLNLIGEADRMRVKRCLDNNDKPSKIICQIKNKLGDIVACEIALSVRRTDRRYAICRMM
jgi:PAS domain S-box-containing protein